MAVLTTKEDAIRYRAEQLAQGRMDRLSATLADLVAKANKNERVLRRYQSFELSLLDAPGLSELLSLLLLRSLRHFSLDATELRLYDPEGILAELLAAQLPQTLYLERSAQFFQQLYGAQPRVQLVNLGQPQQAALFGGRALGSAALLPLVRHGVVVGSLHLGAQQSGRFSSDKATEFIDHLASVIAVCIENAVNQERLQRLSMMDVLTQVKNRRAFDLALQQEVSRAARSGNSLSLLFVDADHFKQINDRYGHPVGDRVLKAIASHMDSMLRKTDHVCRYGGEEFALLLPQCDQALAQEIAERIRQQVARLRVLSDGDEDVAFTLSIGVCCWRPKRAQCEQAIAKALLKAADQGVYRSKEAGRNTITYVDINDEFSFDE